MIIVKIYLRLSLELLPTVWFSSFSDSSLVWLVLLKVHRLLPMQSALTTWFQSIAPVIFQSGSLYFSFCLLVSSVSNFRPDTRGAVVVTFLLGLLVQLCCGEGTNLTGVCGERSQCPGHTGFAPAHGMCAFPVYTAQALGCSAGNYLMRTLVYMHFPGLSHSGSGSWVLHKAQTWLGLRFVTVPGPSSSGDQALCALSCPLLKASAYHLRGPSRSVFWVYNGRAFSGVPCVSSGELVSGCDAPGRC